MNAMLVGSRDHALVAATADAPAPGRRRASEAGLFFLLVAAPLVVFPMAVQPYASPKLALVAAAALFLALHRNTWASALRAPTVVWLGAVTVATVTSVDRWQSLLGRQQSGNGLVLAAACAALLLAGSTLSEDLHGRARRCLIGAGIASAAVGIAASLVPQVSVILTGSHLGFEGWMLPPLGHPVYLGTFCAVGAAAVVPLAHRRLFAASALMVVLVSGVAIGGKRTALLGLGVALVVSARRDRLALRRFAMLAVVSLLTICGWMATSSGSPVTEGARYEEIVNSTARDRITVWNVATRAWTRRPMTGWGPANTAGAVFSSATQPEARVIGRVWQDAHNLIIESAVTAGALGVAGLAWLVVAVARRSRGAPSWALGGVAALAVHHLLQPMHVVLTPLLFLLAGLVAAGPPRRSDRGARVARWPIAALLGAGVAVSSMRFVASGMEASGRLYFQPGLGTLRAAVMLDPSAESATAALTGQIALDRRPEAQREVRALIARSVRQHPFELGSRLNAAKAEMIMGNTTRAAWWVDRHLKIFPYDGYALGYRAIIALVAGDLAAADRFMARSIEIEPGGLGTKLAWVRATKGSSIPRPADP